MSMAMEIHNVLCCNLRSSSFMGSVLTKSASVSCQIQQILFQPEIVFDELTRLGAITGSIADAITQIINAGFGVCQICAYLVIKVVFIEHGDDGLGRKLHLIGDESYSIHRWVLRLTCVNF